MTTSISAYTIIGAAIIIAILLGVALILTGDSNTAADIARSSWGRSA